MGRRKYLKVALNLVIECLLFLFFIFIVPRILVFFTPFVVAAIIAMIANPLVKFLEGKVKIKRNNGNDLQQPWHYFLSVYFDPTGIV